MSAEGGGEGRGPAVERVRLFVALQLPAQVREAISGWVTGAAGADTAASGTHGVLRAAPASGLHATLCFLGWQEREDVGAVGAACEVAAGHGPAALSLGAPRWLPPRRPRVLAIELTDEAGRLGLVQSALSTALHAGGWYQPERRPFLPHVTAARVRRGKRGREGRLPDVPTLTFSATKVILFRSRLTPHGARYEALQTVSLEG